MPAVPPFAAAVGGVAASSSSSAARGDYSSVPQRDTDVELEVLDDDGVARKAAARGERSVARYVRPNRRRSTRADMRHDHD